MPIYEYRCKKGHTFEVMQRITEDPLDSCERCSAPVQRVFHPVAVHFKGSGFYNTDYGTRRRSREGKEGEGSGSSENGAKSGSEAGKSEATKSDASKSKSESPKSTASTSKSAD
jgi:putative FmdB family regulatory protein